MFKEIDSWAPLILLTLAVLVYMRRGGFFNREIFDLNGEGAHFPEVMLFVASAIANVTQTHLASSGSLLFDGIGSALGMCLAAAVMGMLIFLASLVVRFVLWALRPVGAFALTVWYDLRGLPQPEHD